MDYKIFIDGKETEASVKDIKIIDRQGAQADEIKLIVLNSANLIVEKGQFLECSFGGFRSGKMNIDKLSSSTTKTQIGAISAPINAKVKRTRHWLKVRLFDIVNDVASNCGVSVFYQGVTNHYYENVTQFKETDLAFLNRLCTREGYSLKLDDNRLVIYNNALIEKADAVLNIGFNDVIKNQIVFAENPNKIKSVTVQCFTDDKLLSYTAETTALGEEITICEYVFSLAEAERFAKSYLKHFTQNDITVDALIPINDGIASGNCVEFKDFARFDGKYFITECCHDPENNQTRIIGRKIQ